MKNQQISQIMAAREAISIRHRAGESSAALAAEMQISKAQLEQWLVALRRHSDPETLLMAAGQIKATTESILIWAEGADTYGLEETPEFVATPSALQLLALYEEARGLPSVLPPTMALAIGDSGIGKSTTAQAYMRQRTGGVRRTVSGVWYVELPSVVRSNSHLLKRLYAVVFGEEPKDRGLSSVDLQGLIAGKFNEGDLLIIDEAQHMGFEMLDCLRWFNRDHGVGIVLQGNPDYGRALRKAEQKGEHPQIFSRIENRLVLPSADTGDMDALLKAWGVKDTALKRYLHGRYLMAGGLRLMVGVFRKMCIRKPDRTSWTVQDLIAADGSRALEMLV